MYDSCSSLGCDSLFISPSKSKCKPISSISNRFEARIFVQSINFEPHFGGMTAVTKQGGFKHKILDKQHLKSKVRAIYLCHVNCSVARRFTALEQKRNLVPVCRTTREFGDCAGVILLALIANQICSYCHPLMVREPIQLAWNEKGTNSYARSTSCWHRF